MKREETIRKLYECVQTRPRPEDVAEVVLEALLPRLSLAQRNVLKQATRISTRSHLLGYSSMAADFHRPTGMEKPVKVASELFSVPMLSVEECLDPERVEVFVQGVSSAIGKSYGQSDFLKHRMNREQRAQAGLDMGHRAYNKRFRLLGRMESKLLRMVRERKKYVLTRIGKSGFAVEIDFDDFSADLGTACFVAYMSARMSLRSTFTNDSQVRAFDVVAKMLYDRLTKSNTARWDVVAAVYPVDRVLRLLTDYQKGAMLARAWGLLEDACDLLTEVWEGSGGGIDLERMVVRRGCDSSTWNQSAGGWNKARDHWVSMLHAMGMGSMLEALCPGKVMRLMAADVVRWHLASGGDVHPGTKVWAELPYPWDVVAGKERCTKEMVVAACERHGVEPASWVGPRRRARAVEFTPTPELVHGVAVSSPGLALALRRAGVFSAKALRAEHLPAGGFHVDRDGDGFALGATDANSHGSGRKVRAAGV